MAESKQLSTVLSKLKEKGVRITPQRYAILAYLVDTMSHPTADEIYQALATKFPNMSVATVYNNLRLFKEAGLVQELTYGDASSRFDANLEEHYHIICRACGKIEDFKYPPLSDIEAEAAEKTGFKIEDHRMELYGYCPACSAKSNEGEPSREPMH